MALAIAAPTMPSTIFISQPACNPADDNGDDPTNFRLNSRPQIDGDDRRGRFAPIMHNARRARFVLAHHAALLAAVATGRAAVAAQPRRSALAGKIVGRAIWLLLLSPKRFCSSCFSPRQRLSHCRGESRMVIDIIVS
jgi:hypothetical protein